MSTSSRTSARVQRKRAGMKTPEQALNAFLIQKTLLTADFLDGLDIPAMGHLKREELIVNRIKEIVEDTVDKGYYPELVNGPAGQDPVIARFVEAWREDEIRHSDALARVREHATPAGTEIDVPRIPYQATSPFWYRILGTEMSIALVMTWGALNEALTYAVYRRMAEKTQNVTYRRLLEEGIMLEELRHKAFYGSVAAWYLAGRPFRQLLISLILRFKWLGVGADVVPRAYLDYLTAYLFDGKEAWLCGSVGSFIRRLPGMRFFNGDKRLLREARLPVPRAVS